MSLKHINNKQLFYRYKKMLIRLQDTFSMCTTLIRQVQKIPNKIIYEKIEFFSQPGILQIYPKHSRHVVLLRILLVSLSLQYSMVMLASWFMHLLGSTIHFLSVMSAESSSRTYASNPLTSRLDHAYVHPNSERPGPSSLDLKKRVNRTQVSRQLAALNV